MPITAFSRETGRELDLEQWLRLNGYSAQHDPGLLGVPQALRIKVSDDIECSCCGAGGAIIVGRGQAKANGKSVSQSHFRFRSVNGANPHEPLCDYFDEQKASGVEYLANFSSDKSALTRAIRDLVCRGISSGLFSQRDIRAMRQWFLKVKSEHAFVMDVTPALLQWCVDMWAARYHVSAGTYPFRPDHGQLPGYDWKRAADLEWARRNADLFALAEKRVYFYSRNIARPMRLAVQSEGQTVFDPAALRDKYEAAKTLSGFSAAYLFEKGGIPSVLIKHPSEWGPAGHALLALSALLLFVKEWDLDAAVSLFVRLKTIPQTGDSLEGNLMGLNPFHDYEAWQMISAARKIGAQRKDPRPVAQQTATVLAEMQAQHLDWLAAQSATAAS